MKVRKNKGYFAKAQLLTKNSQSLTPSDYYERNGRRMTNRNLDGAWVAIGRREEAAEIFLGMGINYC